MQLDKYCKIIMNNLLAKIKEIAKKNPQGFTVYLPSLEPVRNGWIIANIETQDCFGDEGLKKVVVFAMKYNRIVGGWFNEEDRRYYFDASIIEPNREKAIECMKLHQQIAIINLETFEIIRAA